MTTDTASWVADALQKIRGRLDRLEAKALPAGQELKDAAQHGQSLNRKLDKHLLELQDHLSRLTRAEATHGQLAEQLTRIWSILGQVTGDIVELRTQLREEREQSRPTAKSAAS